MAKYKALRSVMAYPYDGSVPNIEPGTVFDVDEHDPAAKAYIEEVKKTPGAVRKVDAAERKPKTKKSKSTGRGTRKPTTQKPANEKEPEPEETPGVEVKEGAE